MVLDPDITNIETPDTKVTSVDNHYKTAGVSAQNTSGFATNVIYDAAGHITGLTARSITETDIPEIDASKITKGTISIDRLPHGALERLYVLDNRTTAMEIDEISEGDTIMLTDEDSLMFFCVNKQANTFEDRFKGYTAGAATAVSWSGVTDKPTGIDGWGDRISAVEADLDNYLPLTGGTVNGNIKLSNPNCYIMLDTLQYGVDSTYSDIRWSSSVLDRYGYIRFYSGAYGHPKRVEIGGVDNDNSSLSLPLHVNGDITASSFIGNLTGNADSSTYIKTQLYYDDINVNHIYGDKSFVYRLSSNANLPDTLWYGNLLYIGGNDTGFMLASGYRNDRLLFRSGTNKLTDGDPTIHTNEWREVAFTDSNVASATKFQTPRTIWGQSFDGTRDLSGTLSQVSMISFTDAKAGVFSGPTFGSHLTNNDVIIYGEGVIGLYGDKVAIGSTIADAKLHVHGDVKANGNLNVGGNFEIANDYGGVIIKSDNASGQNRATLLLDPNSANGVGMGLDYFTIEQFADRTCQISNNVATLTIGSDGRFTFDNQMIINGGRDLTLKAAANSSDPGDLVFANGVDGELARIYYASDASLRLRCHGQDGILISSANLAKYALPLSGGLSTGNWLALTNTDTTGNVAYISLYNASKMGNSVLPSYGIAFSSTFNAGTGPHGSVTGDGAMYFTMDGANNRGWIFRHANSNVASIGSNGKFHGYDFCTTSDNRLKDFVSDIDLDFEALKLIPKKYYYWKDKSMGEDLQIGTSAQELAKIYPTCVSYDEVSDRYSVNYQKLSIVALAAIDKLHERVSELESKLND